MKKIITFVIAILTGTNLFAQMSLSYTKSSYIGNYGVTCHGAADGWINLTVEGGTPPYTFLWSNNATTGDIANLIAGTYSVTVTDSNNVSGTLNGIELIQPDVLTVSLTLVNITCYGFQNGKIGSSVSGGTTPYTYLWSNSATTGSITALAPGTYSVTVTDANNCTIGGEETVVQPAALTLSFSSPLMDPPYNVTCGSRNGSNDLTVTGGTTPYNYNWNNGQINEDITNLAAGIYKCRVTDANLCSSLQETTLTELSPCPNASEFWETEGNPGTNFTNRFIGTTDMVDLIFKTANDERMRITQGGNVGIGTNNPQAKLDVNGDVRFNGNLNLNNLSFVPAGINDNQIVAVTPSGQVVLYAEDEDPAICNSPQPSDPSLYAVGKWKFGPGVIYTCPLYTKVGINTLNPSQELDVVGDVRITGSRLHVGSDGKVGVGTATIPVNYKFAVNGSVICEDVTVLLNAEWPDYVAEENYKPIPLQELEKYFKEKKHLPQMPSAEEVKSNGISTSGMITKLLRQQEELTLYIIRQQKEIDELKKFLKK